MECKEGIEQGVVDFVWGFVFYRFFQNINFRSMMSSGGGVRMFVGCVMFFLVVLFLEGKQNYVFIENLSF